jgi:hypothetical protein
MMAKVESEEADAALISSGRREDKAVFEASIS